MKANSTGAVGSCILKDTPIVFKDFKMLYEAIPKPFDSCRFSGVVVNDNFTVYSFYD